MARKTCSLRLMSFIKFLITFVYTTATFHITFVRAFQFSAITKNMVCGSTDDLKANGCLLNQTVAVRSNLECSVACTQTEKCIGSFVDNSNVCHFVQLCDYFLNNTNCDQPQSLDIYVIQCLNGGKYVKSYKQGCKCVGGWIGKTCERLAKNCREISDYGYEIDIGWVIWIKVTSRPVKIKCINFKNKCSKYSVIGSTGEHYLPFDWHKYKHGFYIDQSNYFLGLDNMHALLNSNRPKNRLEATIRFIDSDGSHKSLVVWYYGFGINDESTGYTYHYNRIVYRNQLAIDYGVNNSECFADPGEIAFSTWDRDNDLDPINNCAQLSSGGWWYGDCSTPAWCNPFGRKVGVLPPPLTHEHIGLYGLDMINSTVATGFINIGYFFIDFP